MNNLFNSTGGPSETKYQQVHVGPVRSPTGLNRSSQGERRRWWQTSESVVFKTLAYISVLAVPITLAAWLPHNVSAIKHTKVFQGSPLGGSLTLNQAKAIDFVSSAILGPSVIAIFNYVWFANARASLADSRSMRSQGTPLYALMEASGISSGTYDLFKLWALTTSRSGRLAMIAVLTLFAALGKSLLSNFIAYEAFMQPIDVHSESLRLLTGPYMANFIAANQSVGEVRIGEADQTWIATKDQRKQFVLQSTAVLQSVAWQNASELLDSGAYVALNVTQASLSSLDALIVELWDVPAVRATIDCQTHSPESLNAALPLLSFTGQGGTGEVFTQLFFDTSDINSSTFSLASGSPYQGWRVDIPADLKILFDGARVGTESLDFLGYDDRAESMYIGSMGVLMGGTINHLDWWQAIGTPLTTPFGTIQPTFQNVTVTQSNGTACTDDNPFCYMPIWGLKCTINQQHGVANLTRENAGSDWVTASTQWDPTTFIRPSRLADLYDQLAQLVFKPGKAGFGPAFTLTAEKCESVLDNRTDIDCSSPGPWHLDYQTLADNLLYGEMEMQRVVYEIGAMNNSQPTADMSVDVRVVSTVQRYQMTYIPILLSLALGSIFLAAVAAAILAFKAPRPDRNGIFRIVNSLRLMMDSLPSLQDRALQREAIFWTRSEMDAWAKQFRMRYEDISRVKGGSSTSSVTLRNVNRSNMLDVDTSYETDVSTNPPERVDLSPWSR